MFMKTKQNNKKIKNIDNIISLIESFTNLSQKLKTDIDTNLPKGELNCLMTFYNKAIRNRLLTPNLTKQTRIAYVNLQKEIVNVKCIFHFKLMNTLSDIEKSKIILQMNPTQKKLYDEINIYPQNIRKKLLKQAHQLQLSVFLELKLLLYRQDIYQLAAQRDQKTISKDKKGYLEESIDQISQRFNEDALDDFIVNELLNQSMNEKNNKIIIK